VASSSQNQHSSRLGALLVVNPKGGSCDAPHVAAAFEKRARENDIPFRVHMTNGKDDFDALARQADADGYAVIVACGGDGTVSAVASTLVGSPMMLGIVPGGTANVLAKELGISLESEAALDTVFANGALSRSSALQKSDGQTSVRTRSVDAMRVEGKCYFSHVSMGVYSKIAENTRPEVKRKYGQLAYIWQVFKLLRHPIAWRFAISTDGLVHKLTASTVMIASAGSMGALGLQWAPGAKADDGRVAICAIQANRFWEYVSLLFSFLRNRHEESNYVQLFSARREVLIPNRAKLSVRGDGEIIGRSDLRMEVLPAAVTVVVP